MISKNLIMEGEDKLDLDTGYFTREPFYVDSDDCEQYEQTVPQIIIDTKHEHKKRNWYLTTITLPAGTLFPKGEPDSYEWYVAPVVNIDSGEEKRYPIPGSNGEYYQTRIAIEDAKKFKKFKEALVYLGML